MAVSLEKQVDDLADEIKLLDARLGSENERLAHEWTGAGKIPPAITTELVEQLSPQARAIETTEAAARFGEVGARASPHRRASVSHADRIGDGRRRQAWPANDGR